MDFFGLLLTGLIVGWLAGQLMTGKGFGMNGDLAAGVVGALLGGALSERSGIMADGGLLGSLIVGTTGALICLYGMRMFKKV